jgi:glycosyltransferase involved in cell wall biosynthesis
MKILYFIGTLCSGGKERRLIELMAGLKDNPYYEILLVLAFNQIDYDYFHNLGIDYISIDKRPNHKGFKPYLQLNTIIKDFKPDIIHTWGSMQAFYMAPLAYIHRIKFINSQITDAPPKIRKLSFQYLVNKFNFALSDVILANSYAGLKAYGIDESSKNKVIHNGFDMKRIANLESKNSIRNKFEIRTEYVIGMVASFSDKKDYTTYIKAANKILEKRRDITFLCIGAGNDFPYKKMVSNEHKDFIKFLGRQENVESIMNVCDVGVLMSNPDTHGEGISNAIMEFMAIGKPVIATNGGGTNEIITNDITGFLITQKNQIDLSEKITNLLNDKNLRIKIGKNSKEYIKNEFNINKMRNEFINLYNGII